MTIVTTTPTPIGAALRCPDPSGQARGIELLRLKIGARLTRLARWEFWPSWAVYLPLIPYIILLGLRHGGLRVCTRCNPAIPHGGVVGESKWDILRLLPAEAVVPTELIAKGEIEVRVGAVVRATGQGRWGWPVVLKPDVGERGRNVSLVRDASEARDYLLRHSGPVLAQRYHPGPFEAGVFYVRFPGTARGRIFSVTDKRFATVTGDGRSTLRTLVWRHPRYRLQAGAHLSALGDRADDTPGPGECVRLGFAGNHCRGAMFLDGERLITPELADAFDSIGVRTPGFFFGRFDVRYTDEADFAAGRGFEVIELNGLLSESTNIYDPGITFWKAQRVLREQWRLAFQIGAANAPGARA